MAPSGMEGPLPEWSDQTEPLQLVTFDERAKGTPQLVVQEKAREALLQVMGKSPIRAIAVCGVYRTGKSLLLNLLSGTQGKGDFAVGDSVRACTAGLWIRASKPAAKDGSVCLLIDCEGSGNTERDKEHDARLFALAVLISSLLIFNSRGVISDTAVQALALAASLAEHIHRQHQSLASGQRLSPAFLWVLRDFALALEDESGQPITAKQYLEQMLNRFSNVTKPPPGTVDPSMWAEKREAREKIMELFPERDCVPLVRPVDEEEDLQRLGQLTVGQMRPKFAGQVKELRQQVFSGCPVLKSPTGEVATGTAFVALLQAHVEAMNQGSVPNLGDAWQHIQHQECARAVEEGMRVFCSMTLDLASALPVAADDLEQGLARARGAALLKFGDAAMGEEATRNEHERELLDNIAESVGRLRKENEAVAVRKNEAWLQERWAAKVEEPLRKYRQMYDADELLLAECEEAEAELKKNLEDLEAGYWQESVGSKEAYEEPFERLIRKRKDAALREVNNWKSSIQTASEAKNEALRRAEQERRRLNKAGEELARQAKKEAEDSKKRLAAKGQANKDQGGKAPKCCTVQ